MKYKINSFVYCYFILHDKCTTVNKIVSNSSVLYLLYKTIRKFTINKEEKIFLLN